jgi:hypothetical protein
MGDIYSNIFLDTMNLVSKFFSYFFLLFQVKLELFVVVSIQTHICKEGYGWNYIKEVDMGLTLP